ncbi:MAG: ABC transporter permease [Bacteroidetes bacterium]|nr:ABC transporter permease [Bacteroidota bacterium]
MIWKRFKKNKLAVAGLIFICISLLVSVMGYIVVPDHTADVNIMYPDIALKKPGFSCNYLKVKSKSSEKKTKSFFSFFKGWDSDFDLISIDTFWQKNDSIYFKNYNNLLIQNIHKSEIYNLNNISLKRISVLGTDRYGRDLLSRLVIGTRVSIAVGLVAVFISVIIGLLMGLLAGYFRGWVDGVIMWLINIIWSLPTLMFVIALTFAIGKGFWQIFVAIGLTSWVELARIVRGQVFSIREKEFIQAATVMGFSNIRIIVKHILPNIWGTVIIMSVANFASAILLEAGLSFLGQGLQPPAPSLGQMIKENYAFIVFDASHLAIFPGLMIALLVMSVNFIGNGLRDALDVNE